MEPVLIETPPDDNEFDLDVRLQPAARPVLTEKPAPSEGGCSDNSCCFNSCP
jgi:hypothetical protein